MTTIEVTPSGVPSQGTPAVVFQADPTRRFGSVRYTHHTEYEHYRVQLQELAPPRLRVSLELGQEDGGVWAHIPELDVTAEGANIGEAFTNVYSAAREWLTYIQEDAPDLAGELAGQQRYVGLLTAPVFSWFKSFRFAD